MGKVLVVELKPLRPLGVSKKRELLARVPVNRDTFEESAAVNLSFVVNRFSVARNSFFIGD